MFLSLLLLPFIAASISGLFGRYLGRRGTNFLVLNLLFISSFFSLILGYEVVLSGSSITLRLGSWLDTGILNLDWGFVLDPLGAWLTSVVLIISFIVHIFATSYMASDPSPQKFMSLLVAFTGSMVLLVTGDSLGILFLGWEGNLSCLIRDLVYIQDLKYYLSSNFYWLNISLFYFTRSKPYKNKRVVSNIYNKNQINPFDDKKYLYPQQHFHTEAKIPSTMRIGPHNKEVLSFMIGTLLVFNPLVLRPKGRWSFRKRENSLGCRLIIEQSSSHVEYLMWLHSFLSATHYALQIKDIVINLYPWYKHVLEVKIRYFIIIDSTLLLLVL